MSVQTLLPKGTGELHGAAMWPVPGGESRIGLSLPCTSDYEIGHMGPPETHPHWRCKAENKSHAHIILDTEDGVGVVPAVIFSRPFLMFILEHLSTKGIITIDEKDVLLSREQERMMKVLAEVATEGEKRIMLSPELLKRATSFLLAS